MNFTHALVERIGRRFFYGWVIVGVGMRGIFASEYYVIVKRF